MIPSLDTRARSRSTHINARKDRSLNLGVAYVVHMSPCVLSAGVDEVCGKMCSTATSMLRVQPIFFAENSRKIGTSSIRGTPAHPRIVTTDRRASLGARFDHKLRQDRV